MRTDYFAIMAEHKEGISRIVIDINNSCLYINLQPDFERYTKLSWFEKFILLRVFKRLTPKE